MSRSDPVPVRVRVALPQCFKPEQGRTTHPSNPFLVEALCPAPLRLAPTTGTLSPWALLPVGDPVVVCLVRSTFRASVHPLPLLTAGCVLPEDHGGEAEPRETGIRVSASFPAVIEPTHWDWSSSNPALPMRGLTRERLSALDAGPHDASSACCCPLDPFGRRLADRFTRLLPAGSGHSRQDQTNLNHGAPLRSDDTDARSGLAWLEEPEAIFAGRGCNVW